MAIIIDQSKRVLVQGITGREGQARTKLMREYGTNVVAGCTPGKGGCNVHGVPVFSRPTSNPQFRNESDNLLDGFSPPRPAGRLSMPI